MKATKHFRVVEYHFGAENEHFEICEIKEAKGQIELMNHGSVSGWEEFLSSLPSLPHFLLITGRKTLTKVVNDPGNSEEGIQQLVRNAFPAVQPSLLEYEYNPDTNGKAAITITRKEIIDEIQTKWPDKAPLLDIRLGPYSIHQLVIDLIGESAHVGYHQYRPSEECLQVSSPQGEVVILDQKIPIAQAGAFLVGINYCLTKEFYASGDFLLRQREQWIYKNLLGKTAMPSLATILLLLVLSFFAFSHYSSKNQELQVALSHHSQKFEDLEILKKELQEKEDFIVVNGKQSVLMSKMLDQIALSLPKGLHLKKLQVNPVTKIKQKDELVELLPNVIEIQGETKDYLSYKEWIIRLKGLSWVKKLNILGYEEGTNHSASFNLRIEISEE